MAKHEPTSVKEIIDLCKIESGSTVLLTKAQALVLFDAIERQAAVIEEGKQPAYQIVSEGKFADKPALIAQANQFVGSVLEQKRKSDGRKIR